MSAPFLTPSVAALLGQVNASAAAPDYRPEVQRAGLDGDIPANGVDAGPLSLARYTEPLGMLLVQLAYVQGMGARIGAALIR